MDCQVKERYEEISGNRQGRFLVAIQSHVVIYVEMILFCWVLAKVHFQAFNLDPILGLSNLCSWILSQILTHKLENNIILSKYNQYVGLWQLLQR